jgi:hypothetical protein
MANLPVSIGKQLARCEDRPMRRSRRSRLRGALLVAALLAPMVASRPAPAASLQETVNATQRVGESAFDLVILRPLSGAALVVGSAFFVASAPFVAPMGFVRYGASFEGWRPAFSTFVYAPFEYVILRDLGDF